MNFELKNLNENHMGVLIQALDLYTRIGMGQFSEITHLFIFNDQIESMELLDDLKRKYTSLKEGEYKGIGGRELEDKFKIAQDMHEVIRHRLAWTKNPEGDLFVNYSNPFHWGDEPLIEAEFKGV